MPKTIVKPQSRPQLPIGAIMKYREHNTHTITVIFVSPTPGHRGYHDYFCFVERADSDAITHIIVYGVDVFKENSIYEMIGLNDEIYENGGV
jgi:hypothetical protein